MSSTPQSKPAQPTASATMGLADETQVPMGALAPWASSSWRNGFMVWGPVAERTMPAGLPGTVRSVTQCPATPAGLAHRRRPCA